jgi:hypothetical protein
MLGRTSENLGRLPDRAQTAITDTAEQPADYTSQMVVIHIQATTTGGWTLTDVADPTLQLQ